MRLYKSEPSGVLESIRPNATYKPSSFVILSLKSWNFDCKVDVNNVPFRFCITKTLWKVQNSVRITSTTVRHPPIHELNCAFSREKLRFTELPNWSNFLIFSTPTQALLLLSLFCFFYSIYSSYTYGFVTGCHREIIFLPFLLTDCLSVWDYSINY